ncbi:MAG: protein-methionine-sulfoxide reductase catalytic subunit MsrP [Anaerolineales bacterium]|nr:protein-methionine-sulfoxide reductase catalytic subunit MsrP [Anaerolineales bacterium]
MNNISASEITPENTYLSRRQFMMRAGTMAIGAATSVACREIPEVMRGPEAGSTKPRPTISGTDELGDTWNDFEAITNYNNYYEFTTEKERVAALSQNFRTRPWKISVGGLVKNPRIYDIDDLIHGFEQEERVYRLRCVEGWSMVIPWLGFPLRKLLAEVEPTADANHVRFETLYDPQQLPGQRNKWYEWPYVEGLRLDEAMHDLTFIASGIYGKTLLPQNGAPIRLVIPWKYGFKGIKAIVRIDLVEQQPSTLWMAAAPKEYGYYANVNPTVHHPRWSQATERRIGELTRRPTMMFNGYEEEVTYLYKEMDLRRFF